jgi:hypothetical protein
MADEQIEVADKDQCPKCGSRDVRAMSSKETKEFYGGDVIVLTAPRLCRSCKHGWEARPSKLGCYVMIAFSVLGMLLGIGLIVFVFVAHLYWWASGKWKWVYLCGGVGLGLTMLCGCAVTYSKYAAYLRGS